MEYTRADLINALCAEYDYLCHDDFNAETDLTLDEYRQELEMMEHSELVEETFTDATYTLDEYMDRWMIWK